MKTNKIFISALILGVGVFTFNACSSDDDNDPLPPIGGYNTADEVAAASLRAYWPLDGNGTEDISNTAPSATVGTTWEDGIKGQGAKLTAGYMNYPTIANLNTAPSGSMTVTVWAKLSNTKMVAGGESHISEIFNISGSTPGNGYFGVLGETHGLVTSDSIQVKGHYETLYNGAPSGGDIVNMTKMEQWMIDENNNPDNPNPFDHVAFANKIGGQWAQIVYVFNGATAQNMIYVNGVNISNTPWVQRNNGVTPFNLVFAETTHPIIGARSSFIAGTTDVWNKAMTGSVDEIRVFDKALTQAEISALYSLELAGR